MPRNKVTVWAGTSWLKATRKPICSGMVPAIEVKLRMEYGGQFGEGSHGWQEGEGEDGMNVRPALVARKCKEHNHDAKAQRVGQQGGDQEELGELPRGPGPLQVAAAMVQRQGGDGQGEDVALDEGGGEEGPRIQERELGDEVQIRDDDVRVGRPLLVADGRAQNALQAQRDEQDARDGRDVDSGRHGGGRAWQLLRPARLGLSPCRGGEVWCSSSSPFAGVAGWKRLVVRQVGLTRSSRAGGPLRPEQNRTEPTEPFRHLPRC